MRLSRNPIFSLRPFASQREEPKGLSLISSLALFGVREELKKGIKRHVHVGIDSPVNQETQHNTLTQSLKDNKSIESIPDPPRYERKTP